VKVFTKRGGEKGRQMVEGGWGGQGATEEPKRREAKRTQHKEEKAKLGKRRKETMRGQTD